MSGAEAHWRSDVFPCLKMETIAVAACGSWWGKNASKKAHAELRIPTCTVSMRDCVQRIALQHEPTLKSSAELFYHQYVGLPVGYRKATYSEP